MSRWVWFQQSSNRYTARAFCDGPEIEVVRSPRRNDKLGKRITPPWSIVLFGLPCGAPAFDFDDLNGAKREAEKLGTLAILRAAKALAGGG